MEKTPGIGIGDMARDIFCILHLFFLTCDKVARTSFNITEILLNKYCVPKNKHFGDRIVLNRVIM